MMDREEIVGFNRQDADALLEMIEGVGGQRQSPHSRPFPLGTKWGRTKAGGLAANSKAAVYLQVPTDTGWTNGPEVDAWNRGNAIAADKLVLLFRVDGRYCAVEVC